MMYNEKGKTFGKTAPETIEAGKTEYTGYRAHYSAQGGGRGNLELTRPNA